MVLRIYYKNYKILSNTKVDNRKINRIGSELEILVTIKLLYKVCIVIIFNLNTFK
jgi:hypothetical protein